MWRDWDFGRRLFEDVDREFQGAEEMLNRMFRTVREMKPSDAEGTFPYFYGYQITTGPDGKPLSKIELARLQGAFKGNK